MLTTHSRIISNRGELPEGVDIQESLHIDLLQFIEQLVGDNSISFMRLQNGTRLVPEALVELLLELKRGDLIKIIRDIQTPTSLRDFRFLLTPIAIKLLKYNGRTACPVS